MTTKVTARSLWQPGGWTGPVRLDLEAGRISAVSASTAPVDCGWLLPGLPNLHSHAFQRAMAGHAERRGPGADSFWTWREAMYAFADRMTPELLHAIACQLYVEMLEAGYTWVCEFHYLHQQADGRPHADPAAMSAALIEAARVTGIGLTLLPVLYLTGGFDGRALAARQRRFGLTLDKYLALVQDLQARQHARLRVGVALHSLRAVPPDALAAVLQSGLCDDAPIHIHIAEQIAEVEDCLAVRGRRPVRWLLEHAPVDPRWCLVHATHMDAGEITDLAATGATVALCPTTEANLGDGLFPLPDYLAAGGVWGIGSDSNVSVNPVEELRWLEYGQRLHSRQRNIVVTDDRSSVGDSLLAGALHGGRACGIGAGATGDTGNADNAGNTGNAGTIGVGVGAPADLVALADVAPALAGHGRDTLIDAWVFAGNRRLVDRVWAGGEPVVVDGRHVRAEAVARTYRAALAGWH